MTDSQTFNDELCRERKMQKYEQALADYISILDQSAKETHRAEDRNRYQQHLASAALMFVAIVKDRSTPKLKELVAAERHSYGWDYLSEPAGEAAEKAFHTFATMIESE
jgi:trehalose-6-phosphate synthase